MRARLFSPAAAARQPATIQAFFFVLMFFCMSAPAAEYAWTVSSLEHRLEHEIKAAFLYQFGSYVDWPSDAFDDERTPLRIGILDDDEVFELLTDIVRQRTVQGRPVEVLRFTGGNDMERAHILFVGAPLRGEKAHAVIERVRGRPVLTVIDDDVHADGIIRFVVEHDRVRFDVSLARANESRMRISSRLLGVARRVQGEGGS